MHIIRKKEVCGIEKVDAKEIWLNYFNETLFKTGIINKNEHDKMTQLIRKQCHTTTHVGSKNIKEPYKNP